MRSLPSLPPVDRLWKHMLSIKPILLNPRLSLDEKADMISRMMRCLKCKDEILVSLLGELERAGFQDSKQGFNDALNKIYEWADKQDVWLGIAPEDGYLNEEMSVN